MAKKILIVAHGHPDHCPGGGEISAYNLHRKLRNSSEFESVFFARHEKRELLHGGTAFCGNGKPAEVLFYSVMPDWFRFSQPDKTKVWRDFAEVLEACQPDIVHFHHYLHLGLEFIRQVKNHKPDLPVVLTLHEYFGICHNHGQMVKTEDKSLCLTSSPIDCANCFPERSAQDFFLRKQFIQSQFALVDQFISPSIFLAERYGQWGLAKERISVIENILTDDHQKAIETSSEQSAKVRLAYFGQINWFKGVDLLLDALELISASVRVKLQVDINGSGLEKQGRELRSRLTRAIERNDDVVRLRGPYAQTELPALMLAADWVVVPSKWWENSPVVILEARKYGVPVICSNIGGMAEKVEHGKSGLHFMARRAESLADSITWVVENRHQQPEFAHNMASSYSTKDAFGQHLELYCSVLDQENTTLSLQVV